MQNDLAPIVLFVYNRPQHTLQTLEALRKNDLANESVLYVFADGPKENVSKKDLEKIQEVSEIVKKEKWCKEVNLIKSNINQGLAGSVINGVTQIINEHGKIIVLEDDIITAKGFLKYMNDALAKFQNFERVMQISGHCFPSSDIVKNHSSFFVPMTTSWGWATWKRAWNKFKKDAAGYEVLKKNKTKETKFNLDNSYPYSPMLITQMEGKGIDSWAIRWWWSIFIENGVSLFPDASLVKNVGYGDEATHTNGPDPFQTSNFDENYRIDKFPSEIAIQCNYFDAIKASLKESSSHMKKPSIDSKLSFVFKFLNNVKQLLVTKKVADNE